MNTNNRLTLSTSPLSQPARKPHGITSLGQRQRLLYGRKRRYPTGKERDNETGLYYYGARYLDSRTSRWLSGDPAVGDYIPSAPVNDEARKRNGNLPGQGGVFNYVNLHVYHYAGNNPVKYIDPNGRENHYEEYINKQRQKEFNKPENRVREANDSRLCNYNTLVGAAEQRTGKNLTRYDKDSLRIQLQSGDNSAVLIDGHVERADNVLNAALEKLDMGNELSASLHPNKPVNFDKIDPKDILTQRRFEDEMGRLTHANLGDSEGNFLWEPLDYNNVDSIRTGPADKLRYIIFTEKKE